MNELTHALISTCYMLESALPSVFIGLFLANLMSAGRFSNKVSNLLPAIERLTRLPNVAALVMLLSIADRTAGMAALEAARRQSGLTNRQVVAVNIAAKAPSVAQFFLFSFMPLMLSLFPYRAAVGFLIGYFLAFMVISAIGLILLRTCSDSRLNGGRIQTTDQRADTWGNAVFKAFSQAAQPFGRIALWMFSMSVVVTLVIQTGMLSTLTGAVSLSGNLIGTNAIPLVGAGLISMIGGVAAVGTAWQEGLIGRDSIIPLLFLISIVHNIYDLFSSSVPRTIAVYGRELGWKVSIISFFVTEAVMILFFILAIRGVFM